MMPDIFSSFDPMMFSKMNPSLTMITVMLIIIPMQMSFWQIMNRMSSINSSIMSIMTQQLSRTFSTHLKGMTTSINSFFMMIIFINLAGLNPYTLAMSSHLIFTLILGLPMWLMMIISSMSHNPKSFIAHLLPDGAPTWLNPFLIMIETISITVRPLTLSFRLAANMSAGHIVLSLINIYAAPLSGMMHNVAPLLILTSMLYILFEMAICLIQAYIFCLLLSLYSDDHAH